MIRSRCADGSIRTGIVDIVAWQTGGERTVAGERYVLTIDETLVAILVVTYESVGTTNLEVGNGLLDRLPELLLAEVVTQTH